MVDKERHRSVFLDNPEILKEIYEKAGCHNMSWDKGQLRGAEPWSKNASKVWIDPSGSGVVFSSGERVSGSIYTLTGYFLTGEMGNEHIGEEFVEEHTKNIEIKSFEGADFFIFYNEYEERQEKIKKLQSRRSDKYDEDLIIKIPLKVAMRRTGWVKGNHQLLIDEFIYKKQADRYNIHIDTIGHRILFPYLHPEMEEDMVIGVQGRTIKSKEECERYQIDKYKNYKFGEDFHFNKRWTFFGLKENLADINKSKACVIFEAEKSVLKMSRLKHIGIACGGSQEFTQRQIDLLDNLLEPDVSIIIALDKDVSEYKSFNIAKQASVIRRAYYLYDKNDILKDPKASPIDEGGKPFKHLFKNRVEVNMNDEWEKRD